MLKKIRFNFSIQSRLSKFTQTQKQQKDAFYPVQHPKNLDLNNTLILKREKLKYLTPQKEIPVEFQIPKEVDHEFETPKRARTLNTIILGAPNAGKSSLLNSIVNTNISAVSNKANTTDETVTGIYTNIDKKVQLVIKDTPGIIRKFKGNSGVQTLNWEQLQDSNLAIFVIDSVKRVGDDIKTAIKRLDKIKYQDSRELDMLQNDEYFEQFIENKLELKQDSLNQKTISKILVLTKMDLCTNIQKLNDLVNDLQDLSVFDKVFYVSSQTQYGITDLIQYLEEQSVHDQTWEINPKYSTPQSDIERVEQIFKQVIYSRFYYEIPHMIGISCIEFAIRSDNKIKLSVQLTIQTKIQSKMVSGYKGKNLDKIKNLAEVQLIKIFQRQFIIDIQVKIKQEEFNQQNIIQAGDPLENSKLLLEQMKKFNKQGNKQMIQSLLKSTFKD